MTTTHIGGPGVACSAMRIRRLAAGELAGEERARTEHHLAGCARCQRVEREIAAERGVLAADLPFDTFAAGVAERLARGADDRRRPGAAPRRAVGMAIAAGLAFALAVPAVLHLARERSQEVRTKGGVEITVWIEDGGSARALGARDPVPGGAALRVGLGPAARRFAVVVLLDADGAAILHAGAARAGVLPGAFVWTGAGEGALVAVLDDTPIDAAALAHRLAREGVPAAAPHAGAEVIVRPLRRDVR